MKKWQKKGNYIWNHCEIPKSRGTKLIENTGKQARLKTLKKVLQSDSEELLSVHYNFKNSKDYKTLYERSQMCRDLAFHNDLVKQEFLRSYVDNAL